VERLSFRSPRIRFREVGLAEHGFQLPGCAREEELVRLFEPGLFIRGWRRPPEFDAFDFRMISRRSSAATVSAASRRHDRVTASTLPTSAIVAAFAAQCDSTVARMSSPFLFSFFS
jgi:hypothetical protein